MLSSEDQICIYLRFEWLDDDGSIVSEKLYGATIQMIIRITKIGNGPLATELLN